MQDERDGVSPAVLLTGDLVADLGSFRAPDRGCPLQPEDEEEWLSRPKVRGSVLALVPRGALRLLPGGRRESRRRSNNRAGARDWQKFAASRRRWWASSSCTRSIVIGCWLCQMLSPVTVSSVWQTSSHRSLAAVGRSEWTGTEARAAAEDEDQTHGGGHEGRHR